MISKTRCIFLYIFVGLLMMSAFQFFMLEQCDLSRINMVEEQQETFGKSVEVLGESFKSVKFELYSSSLGEAFKQKYSIIHIDKDYPAVTLEVPYSPPELS